MGIGWNTKRDSLNVVIDDEKFAIPATTPRMVVQQQAALYDPLGMIAPFILLGRQWTQSAMQGPWGWDIKLKPEVEKGFNCWTKEIPLLREIEIPRSWDTEETLGEKSTRHVFVDACDKGYGCVVYRRVVGRDGSIRVMFLQGRSHVIPNNKSRSSHHGPIPKLELVAAVCGMKAENAIKRSLPDQKKEEEGEEELTVFHTDSRIVHAQIWDETSWLKAFKSNRITKILHNTVKEQWQIIPGKLNPANLASRGIRAGDTEKWDIYLNGPLFLREKEENWPIFQADLTPEDQIAHIDATRVLLRTYNEELSLWWYDEISRVSGWLKKINMMAAVLKVTTKWRAKVVISRKNWNKEEDKDETKRKTKKDFNRRQEKDWKEVSSGIESQRS